jgi:hypothetical protein
MTTRRTARTIVVWIALLLLIASWFLTYFDREWHYVQDFGLGGGSYSTIQWERLVFIDLAIIAVAAGFLFTFRGGNNR